MQLKPLVVTMTFQRTVTTSLTLCLSPGVHPRVPLPSICLVGIFFSLSATICSRHSSIVLPQLEMEKAFIR
jgi:hypothetical protein